MSNGRYYARLTATDPAAGRTKGQLVQRQQTIEDELDLTKPWLGSRTGVAPVSDIVWDGYPGRILVAVNSHLLVRQGNEDGDRHGACPTPPASMFN